MNNGLLQLETASLKEIDSREVKRLIEEDGVVFERKWEGCQIKLHIGAGYECSSRCDTRRVSKKTGQFVERSEVLYHIAGVPFPKEAHGSIVVGEVITDGVHLEEVTSILNSLPEKGIARQREIGFLSYVMYDILFFRGSDLRRLPFIERSALLYVVYRDVPEELKPYVVLSQVYETSEEKRGLWEDIPKKGWEGIVVKENEAPYHSGQYKWKRSRFVPAFVLGFKEGKGKYEGLVGSLEMAVWEGTKPVSIGYVNAGTDEMRHHIVRNKNAFLGTVLLLEGFDFTSGGKLRNPRHADPREAAEAGYDVEFVGGMCVLGKMVADDCRR